MTAPQSPAIASKAPPGGLALSCAVLLLVMLAAFGALAAWTTSTFGNNGLWAALVAFVLCTVAAMVALVVSVMFANTPHAMSANLGVMLVRMGAPLMGLTVLPQQLPTLATVGLTHSILALYLVALVAETLLALRHVVKTPASGVSNRTAEAK